MKAAVLLQGDPRFCQEFDMFLENLKGFDQVDYFMYMWEHNTPTANLLNGDGHQVVAPAWQELNRIKALQRFQELLPKGHRVVALELGNQHDIEWQQVTENFAPETRQGNVWKMLYSLYMANNLRVKYETENNVTYDMVIRTRPDVALMTEVDAEYLKPHLDNDPNLVIIPKNKRCGYYNVMICDLFGISTPETMTVYCDLYNQAISHHKAGCIFHPETLLAKHLQYNNKRYWPGNFEIEFRHLGRWRDTDTGEEWTSNKVPTWNNKIYVSKFGRWE